MSETKKTKFTDGTYYPIDCPRCGKGEGPYIRGSKILVCTICNNDEGVVYAGDEK